MFEGLGFRGLGFSGFRSRIEASRLKGFGPRSLQGAQHWLFGLGLTLLSEQQACL